MENDGETKSQQEKWSLGVLNDKLTDEVPGSVLLMSNASRNEPLGLRNAPARTSASSLPSPFPPSSRSTSRKPHDRRRTSVEKKRTKDGKIILDPQPEDTLNDPLNWPSWRRDVALMSLGFYCMLGGGMTPVLAAGFTNVANTYDVSVPQVALTTGLYMMGLGLGSVIASPTAILWGKRPVYLVGIVLYILSAVWCALSPSYSSLVIARIFMGIAVSPCECLPSATIAEIFYLHERAYRLGIYTLLLLGGKNLIPLVSAAIIESLDWRWVFWIIAIVVGFCLVLMFLFVPETFWDRKPVPHKSNKQGLASWSQMFHFPLEKRSTKDVTKGLEKRKSEDSKPHKVLGHHVGFVDDAETSNHNHETKSEIGDHVKPTQDPPHHNASTTTSNRSIDENKQTNNPLGEDEHTEATNTDDVGERTKDVTGNDKFQQPTRPKIEPPTTPRSLSIAAEADDSGIDSPVSSMHDRMQYTAFLRDQPPQSYLQTLKPWNGRLRKDKWLIISARPFILFAYPAILWSALVYSLSVGWLIVLSESVSEIYKEGTYHFNSLQAGLVYISPFIGGILGTAVAGKLSDVIVQAMSRRNGGIYEPEFRLVMAIPVAISTAIGLMGFGWSAENKDAWIVPTVFFGVISFGCSLGSTTSITFAVDSYRQYAGEALVTLNFSKNICHGLVFSLFFNHWLDAQGSKKVFVAIGGIQLGCLLFTIPMYIYGKRARMWTVRKNLIERY